MPVYNCDVYLREALASLLIQTFEDFEIVAVNDGSTDKSLKILEEFRKIDSRIRIISQKNSGIVKALNKGIGEARSDYIARMDGDDICFPNRFADQIKILDEKPDVVLVAGNFEAIDQNGEFLYREFILPDSEDIRRAFYLRNAIAHGSTMFRKKVVQKIGGYSNKYGPTEDLDLWMRLLKEGEFAATSSPIYKWRMNQGGLTLLNNKESMSECHAHIERYWGDGSPMYLTRKEILQKAKKYYSDYDKYGIHYKEVFLNDISQLAAKLFTHGHKFKGLKQLVILASTRRTGLRIAIRRVGYVIGGKIFKN